MVGFVGAGGGGFDYVQAEKPSNPQSGELWFDTDGGSDGNGEAKAYDGTAWEATGYTRHGDLTGVTRDAHHPPVTVSSPLTQLSDQSLGISIGSGLTDSNGTLVAALGDGLGVDASGQVYVPASAVSQSMLAFDTATQGELDAHASSTDNPHSVDHGQLTGVGSSDHHSRPTGTASHTPDFQSPAFSKTKSTSGPDSGTKTVSFDVPPFPAAGASAELDMQYTHINEVREYDPSGAEVTTSASSLNYLGRVDVVLDSENQYSYTGDVTVNVDGALPTEHSHSI